MSSWPLHLGTEANLCALWIMVAQKGGWGKMRLDTRSELAQQESPHCGPRMGLQCVPCPPLLPILAGSCDHA